MSDKTIARRRVAWGDMEIRFLLNIIKDKDILNLLARKRYRNADVYEILSTELKKMGYFKTGLQIRVKFKSLKCAYFKAKDRELNIAECPYYDQLEDLFERKENPSKNYDSSAEPSTFALNSPHKVGPNVRQETGRTRDEKETENKNKEQNTIKTVLKIEPTEDIEDTDENQADYYPEDEDAEDKEGPSEYVPNRKSETAYKKALEAFANEWRNTSASLQQQFLQQQQAIIADEMERQRQWETEMIEKERIANEQMMTNLMKTFFENMQKLPKL